MTNATLVLRRPVSARVALFASGRGTLITVDSSIANRGLQTGGRVEGGFRFTGERGTADFFAGYERRIDGFPTSAPA